MLLHVYVKRMRDRDRVEDVAGYPDRGPLQLATARGTSSLFIYRFKTMHELVAMKKRITAAVPDADCYVSDKAGSPATKLKEAMGINEAKHVTCQIFTDELGVSLKIGSKEYDVFEMAEKNLGAKGSDLDWETDEDEEAFHAETARIIDELIASNGVTHVIDLETFGDENEHPISEYSALVG